MTKEDNMSDLECRVRLWKIYNLFSDEINLVDEDFDWYKEVKKILTQKGA